MHLLFSRLLLLRDAHLGRLSRLDVLLDLHELVLLAVEDIEQTQRQLLSDVTVLPSGRAEDGAWPFLVLSFIGDLSWLFLHGRFVFLLTLFGDLLRILKKHGELAQKRIGFFWLFLLRLRFFGFRDDLI